MPVKARVLERHEAFGRCLVLDNGYVEAYTTIECGPRVIRLARPGGANLFFADVKGALCVDSPEYKAVYGATAVYRFYGGHRLWQSPEYIATTYAPDNDPVTVTTLPDGALFTPPPRTRQGLQFSMRLSLAEDAAALTAEHTIVNIGAVSVTLAPWAITQLRPGGVAILPQSGRPTGFLPDRLLALWPYTDMSDARTTWGRDAILVRQEPGIAQRFKMGLYNRDGWGVYAADGDAFIKRVETPEGERYSDYGVNFEIYTDDKFLEMETLGPLRTLMPGERTVHTEHWYIADAPVGLDRDDAGVCLAWAKGIV